MKVSQKSGRTVNGQPQIDYLKILREKAQFHLSEYQRLQRLADEVEQAVQLAIPIPVSAPAQAAAVPTLRAYVRPPTLSRRPSSSKDAKDARERMTAVRTWVTNRIKENGPIAREEIDPQFPEIEPKPIASMLWRHFRFDKDTNKWSLKE